MPAADIAAGDHASSNSRSGPEADTAARSCRSLTGRATIARTDSTGNPSPSASSIETALETGPGPSDADAGAGAMRARTADAPAACNDTPCHENGSTTSSVWPVIWWLTIKACMAASSNAGWTPKPLTPPAASGSRTSANTSSSRTHVAVRPLNAGP